VHASAAEGHATPLRSNEPTLVTTALGAPDGGTPLMTKTSDDAASLVSIGQLAKAAGVSSRTIRYYEELGILPEPRRSPGGTRKYPREYGGYIASALALKDLGFRLEEVKPLARLAAGRSVSQGQRDAAARLVEDKIEALARQVTMLRRLHASVSAPDSGLPVSAVLGTAALGTTALGTTALGRTDLGTAPAAHADSGRTDLGRTDLDRTDLGRTGLGRTDLGVVPPLPADGAA
jgi:DNA-binding transcriptional MerR regulator